MLFFYERGVYAADVGLRALYIYIYIYIYICVCVCV